jgi:hypothetical protein
MYFRDPQNRDIEISITFRSALVQTDTATICAWLSERYLNDPSKICPAFSELAEMYKNILLSDYAYAIMVLSKDIPIFLVELHDARNYDLDQGDVYQPGDFCLDLTLSPAMYKNVELFASAFSACVTYFFSMKILNRLWLPLSFENMEMIGGLRFARQNNRYFIENVSIQSTESSPA